MEPFTQVDVSPKRAVELIAACKPILDRFTDEEVAFAGITLAILGQRPTMDPTKVVDLVVDVFDYIAFRLTDTSAEKAN